MTAWQGLRHSEHGGIHLIPDGVDFAALAGRGWEPVDTPEGVDASDQAALQAALDAQFEAERAEAVEKAETLTGAALAQALKDAGISGTGLTADEKRARLAEKAGQAGTTDTDNESEGSE
jgi:hypothetical protein